MRGADDPGARLLLCLLQVHVKLPCSPPTFSDSVFSTSTESLTESLYVGMKYIYFLSVTPSMHNGDRKGCDWSSKNIIFWSSKNEDQDDAMHDIYYTYIILYYIIIICSMDA